MKNKILVIHGPNRIPAFELEFWLIFRPNIVVHFICMYMLKVLKRGFILKMKMWQPIDICAQLAKVRFSGLFCIHWLGSRESGWPYHNFKVNYQDLKLEYQSKTSAMMAEKSVKDNFSSLSPFHRAGLTTESYAIQIDQVLSSSGSKIHSQVFFWKLLI
jgi:hypothetical protein